MDSQNTIKYLYLNTRNEFFRVEIADIAYFEADGNYTCFVLCSKQKGVVTMNLAQMQTVLSERLKEKASMFARIGKRFIINLHYVYHIDVARQKLTLNDRKMFTCQLSISKEALKQLKDMYVVAVQLNS